MQSGRLYAIENTTERGYTDGMTDELLMLAVREGAVEKLGELFDRHHRQLFNVLLRLTGNRHLSEDLVQEVFVRILKYRRTYREENRFVTWMFQIARNVRIDNSRRSSAVETNVEDSVVIFPSAAPSPAEHLERQEEMGIMLEALSELSEERREVLLLRGFQGLKFEEIASILECPVNTVKARAFRAIRELRTAVEQIKGRKSYGVR